MTKRQLLAYLAYAGERDFCLVSTPEGYRLIAVGTKDTVAFDAVQVLANQRTGDLKRIT